MKRLLPIALIMAASGVHAATTYTDRAAFNAALAALNPNYDIVSEGFENAVTWGPSRTSIIAPGSAPSITSQGLTWSSNTTGGDIATGAGAGVGGGFGIFSLPHGDVTDSIVLLCDALQNDPPPTSPCWQDDGWLTTATTGATMYGYGGLITTNTGGGAKITFLLDGVDVSAALPENPDNINRDGLAVPFFPDPVPGFFGVIDAAGFSTVEVRELAGKDSQQEFIFGDSFTIGGTGLTAPVGSVPAPASMLLLLSGLGLLGVSRLSGPDKE